MRACSPSDPIRLTPSFRLAAVLLAPLIPAMILLFQLPLPISQQWLIAVCISLLAVRLATRHGLLASPKAPAIIQFRGDDVDIRMQDGTLFSAKLLPGTLILPWVVSLQLHPGSALAMPRTLLACRWNCPAAEFRHLRRQLVARSL